MSWLKDMTDGESVLVALLIVIIVFGGLFGLFCLEAWIAMLLWNVCLVGAVAFVSPIGFWSMMGIMVLFNILFKTVVSASKKD